MNGFVAGVIGNIPALLLDKLASLLNIEKLDYEHFAAALAFQGKVDSIGKIIFSIIIQLMFAGFLGVVFVYTLKIITVKYFYIKAAIFGAFIWFAIYSADIIFKIPEILELDFASSVSHFCTSIIWGLVTGFIYKNLREKDYVS